MWLTVPLYIQIVQGRTPLRSAVTILPYALAIAAAGVLSVRLYARFSPRRLGVASFVLIATGLVVVSFTIDDTLSSVGVILGLLLVGAGEGTLLTLLFNVLVSASPKRLAGDVGALRGVANNVSNALGASLASVVAVGLLGIFLASAVSRSALLAIFPAPRLPGYVQGELSAEDIVSDARPGSGVANGL
jgi:MFS family permease